MYNNEENIWLNQQFFFHKDTEFNTNTALEISLAASTQDLKNFSLPMITVSLINFNDKRKRTCSINIQTLYELVAEFKNFSMVSNFLPPDITRKFGNRELQILFKKSKINLNQTCVLMSISFSESDFGRIVLKIDVAASFFRRLEFIHDTYETLCFQLFQKFYLSTQIEKLDTLTRKIETLPSFISDLTKCSSINIMNAGEIKTTSEEESTLVSNENYEELDNFMGKDFSNIKVPEIDDSQKNHVVNQPVKIQEIKSKFITKVLKGDMYNIEQLINSSYIMPTPILTIIDSIKNSLEIDDQLYFLPGISEDDLKSSLYLSKYLFSVAFQNYTINGAAFPVGVPMIIFKPDPEIVKEFNAELAVDLLLITSYLKSFKNKMEDKEQDSITNKSLIYYALRCFTDILVFSFIASSSFELTKNLVIKNYEHYKSNGFFLEYENILERYRCSSITHTDILDFLNLIFGKMNSTRIYASNLQDFLYSKGNVKIPSSNSFSIEQILNEVVRLEVAEKLGSDLTDENEIRKYIDLEHTSKEVLALFSDNEKKSIRKKESILVKYIKRYENEIPEKIKENFILHISQIGSSNTNFDFNNKDFKAEELGDHIIKSIYEWNQSEKKDTYTDFYMKSESCILTKDLIINKEKINVHISNDKTVDWSSLTK